MHLQSGGGTILTAQSAFVEVAASIEDGGLAPEGDRLLREVASLYILLTERGINWRESELQLFLVHSRSLHRMQHYLTPSVIYVMNWELEFLLVLDKSSVCTGCNTAFIVTCW